MHTGRFHIERGRSPRYLSSPSSGSRLMSDGAFRGFQPQMPSDCNRVRDLEGELPSWVQSTTEEFMLSHVWFFANIWICPKRIAHRVPLSMECSRQEYWSRFPFPPQGDLSNTGIKPASLASPALADGFLTTVPPRQEIKWQCLF